MLADRKPSSLVVPCLTQPKPKLAAPKRDGKAPVAVKKKMEEVVNPNSLFEKRPKQFGIGGALSPKRIFIVSLNGLR